MKPWPKHRGVDLDSDGLSNDDTESQDQISGDIGADAVCRIAECGNGGFGAVGNTEDQRKKRVLEQRGEKSGSRKEESPANGRMTVTNKVSITQ